MASYSLSLRYMEDQVEQNDTSCQQDRMALPSLSPSRFSMASTLLHPSAVKSLHPLSLHLFFLAFFSFILVFSVRACGCVHASSFFFFFLTRRNMRAAGEFSSYPSALKPRYVLEAKRVRESNKGGERMRGRKQ